MRPDVTSQVVVNGRFLARRLTGVERYGREILRYVGINCRVESTRRQGWMGHAWEQFILPTKLDQNSILWSPANTGPLLIREQALTLHDLSPLEHPEWFQTNFANWYRLFLPLLARRVQTVFTPSEYVKRKIAARFGLEHVTVTPNGVDCSIFHPDAKQSKFDLPACYVLFVGTLEPRKNLEVLLRAWDEIKDDFRETWLVIVGVNGNVFRNVNYQPPTERVRFLGYVDDETLAGLYANATLFVLPSREEGFGLPALEAMASGTPVIVSDGGALPEVVGEAGLIFCLSEPDGLKNALRECLSNAGLRSALKEKGLHRARKFSWQTTAQLVWKSLNET
ncbi:MAG: glycosyltransferase family 1 protein [Chloroflexi bacterium]|nr:MAG: glycosyltransferase family 1 protein [Chloroflexota bacterium]